MRVHGFVPDHYETHKEDRETVIFQSIKFKNS